MERRKRMMKEKNVQNKMQRTQSVIGASETLAKQTITNINTSYNQINDFFFVHSIHNRTY